MGRQYLVPDVGYVNEVATRDYLVPGSGYVDESTGTSFVATAGGGLKFGGTVTPGVTFSPAPSGGLVFGGTAAPGITWNPAPSGGLVFGGTLTPGVTWNPTASGGLILGGTATATPTYSPAPSGGVTFGSTATAAFSLGPLIAAGVKFGGTAAPGITWSPVVAPGVAWGGAGSVSATFALSVSGGVVLGSQATAGITYQPIVVGGIVFGGTATTSYMAFGGVPLPSDHAAYEAIRGLLLTLGEFQGVLVGREVQYTQIPKGWQTWAVLEPVGNPLSVPERSPLHVFNVATYNLTLHARRSTDEQTYRVLDRLKDVVLNLLLSPASRAYGGFCLPWKSTLVVTGIPGGKAVGKVQQLRGTFAYSTNLVTGFDPAPV